MYVNQVNGSDYNLARYPTCIKVCVKILFFIPPSLSLSPPKQTHTHTHTDDIGPHEIDDTTDSFTDLQTMDDQEASPASKHSGSEDMVVLDDASEADKEDTSVQDDDHHRISTTSDDVLGGIAGEGAELHPEFDDFEDDQHFEVLETADGDLSEGQESSEVEQSPADRERGKNKEREKLSSEKSGKKIFRGLC